jgi:hypothetical protein
MKTIKIDYSTYEVEGDEVSQEILDLIEEEYGYELYGDFKLREVTSPFIIADNDFDLRESNNEIIEIGVERSKVVSFNGGAFYIEYVKSADTSIVVQGNSEEGYNIFILK